MLSIPELDPGSPSDRKADVEAVLATGNMKFSSFG